MKILLALVCALLFAVLGTTPEAQAQPYTVCNNSNAAVAVCVRIDCGGISSILAPCPVMIAPNTCFTWMVPAGCFVTVVRVNGVPYAVPSTFPYCYPVGTPPPYSVCFTGGVPQVRIF